MATTPPVDEVPEEDFDAVNAEAAEEETADDSPNVSEYSTEDEEEVSMRRIRARFVTSQLQTLRCRSARLSMLRKAGRPEGLRRLLLSDLPHAC
jgi:hypothetical protein